MHSIFYESSKLKKWMCELCTFSQIRSHMLTYNVIISKECSYKADLQIANDLTTSGSYDLAVFYKIGVTQYHHIHCIMEYLIPYSYT